MSGPKKILLGAIIFAVFTIAVFVKNVHVNNRYTTDNFLDIQMEIHYRMYVLVLDISERYQQKSEEMKVLLGYVEKLHKEVIILSNDNRLTKITTCDEDPESLRWMSERLIYVMQPIDKVRNENPKIITLIMSKEIEYLHSSVRFIAGDRMEEAILIAEDFTKKFQK